MENLVAGVGACQEGWLVILRSCRDRGGEKVSKQAFHLFQEFMNEIQLLSLSWRVSYTRFTLK